MINQSIENLNEIINRPNIPENKRNSTSIETSSKGFTKTSKAVPESSFRGPPIPISDSDKFKMTLFNSVGPKMEKEILQPVPQCVSTPNTKERKPMPNYFARYENQVNEIQIVETDFEPIPEQKLPPKTQTMKEIR